MRAGEEIKGKHLSKENDAFFSDESDDDFDVCLDILLLFVYSSIKIDVISCFYNKNMLLLLQDEGEEAYLKTYDSGDEDSEE